MSTRAGTQLVTIAVLGLLLTGCNRKQQPAPVPDHVQNQAGMPAATTSPAATGAPTAPLVEDTRVPASPTATSAPKAPAEKRP